MLSFPFNTPWWRKFLARLGPFAGPVLAAGAVEQHRLRPQLRESLEYAPITVLHEV